MPSTIADRWAALPSWTRCAGGSDPLWTPESGAEAPGRGGFDDYVAHMPGAFAWLVVAEPVGVEAIERELLGLETTMPRLRQRENSEPDRIALLRAEGRYRELSRAQPAGLWTVHVLVGAPPCGRRATAIPRETRPSRGSLVCDAPLMMVRHEPCMVRLAPASGAGPGVLLRLQFAQELVAARGPVGVLLHRLLEEGGDVLVAGVAGVQPQLE